MPSKSTHTWLMWDMRSKKYSPTSLRPHSELEQVPRDLILGKENVGSRNKTGAKSLKCPLCSLL